MPTLRRRPVEETAARQEDDGAAVVAAAAATATTVAEKAAAANEKEVSAHHVGARDGDGEVMPSPLPSPVPSPRPEEMKAKSVVDAETPGRAEEMEADAPDEKQAARDGVDKSSGTETEAKIDAFLESRLVSKPSISSESKKRKSDDAGLAVVGGDDDAADDGDNVNSCKEGSSVHNPMQKDRQQKEEHDRKNDPAAQVGGVSSASTTNTGSALREATDAALLEVMMNQHHNFSAAQARRIIHQEYMMDRLMQMQHGRANLFRQHLRQMAPKDWEACMLMRAAGAARSLQRKQQMQAALMQQPAVQQTVAGASYSFQSMTRSDGSRRVVSVNDLHGFSCCVLRLRVPPGTERLGIAFRTNGACGMVELRGLSPDSPLSYQVPPGWRQNCCVASLESPVIGSVQPYTAEECVGLFAKVREGLTGDVGMEMLLIQPNPDSEVWRDHRMLELQRKNLALEMKRKGMNNTQGGNPSGEPSEGPPILANAQKPAAEPAKAEDDHWMIHYRDLLEHSNKRGNFRVRPSSNPGLAQWIQDQHKAKEQGTLAPDRLEKLNQIGFFAEETVGSLEASPATKGKSKSNVDQFREWQVMYKKLFEYHKKNGHFDVASSTETDEELAGWVREQREKWKLKKLTKRRVEELNKLQFQWVAEPPWDDMYNSLKRFKSKCDFLPNSGHLHEWIERQKETMESIDGAGEEAQSRVQKLHELGVAIPSKTVEILKQAGVVLEGIGADGDDTNEDDEAQGPPSKKRKLGTPSLNGNACQPFWQSAEAAKMFGFEKGEDVLKGLQERVVLLRKANESVDGWKELIPSDGIEEKYVESDILLVRHKAQYLARAYILASRKMNTIKWRECCQIAADELSEIGLTKVSGDTIRKYQKDFCNNNRKFPHPNKHTKVKQDLSAQAILDYFPTAKERLIAIANENMHQLTGNLVSEKIATDILPMLERESREKGCFDDGSIGQTILVRLLAKPPDRVTATRWLHHCNIKWDPYCRLRGRNGTSYQSLQMKKAWASGKYANRRPKGQGLKRKSKKSDGDADDVAASDGDDNSVTVEGGINIMAGEEDDIMADLV